MAFLLRRVPRAASSSASAAAALGVRTVAPWTRPVTAPGLVASYSAASSALNAHVIVRYTPGSDGSLALPLPLPGLPGLTPIRVRDASRTVHDLLELIKQTDASLKAVELTTPNGTKLARTVQLADLTAMEFMLRLNHVNVLVQNEVTKEDPRQRNDTAAFASVKAALEKHPQPYMPLSEYYKICQHAGGDEPMANKWLRELQRRNVAVHFDRSTNSELQKAILLRPYSGESVLTLQNALDSELYNIKHDARTRETKLHELESELKKALAVDDDVRRAARKLPNAYKWVAFTGISSFYGSLMYCVWDVYSWDVMEPITYFIGFTAVLANSFYHSVTKKDATYTNIWQKKYLARLAECNQARKHDPSKIQALQKQISDVQKDLDILTQYERKPLA